MLAGGRTTPDSRAELAIGGAVRVLYGELEEAGDRADESSAGVAPVARIAYGLGDRSDLSLMVSGAVARAAYRQVMWANEASSLKPSLRFGVGLEGGYSSDGGLVGLDVPLVLAVNATSIVEAWIGPRVGLFRTFGALEATQVRIGGVVGLAAGFRHLHVILELTGQYEIWIADDDEAVGLALTPAFGVRYRF